MVTRPSHTENDSTLRPLHSNSVQRRGRETESFSSLFYGVYGLWRRGCGTYYRSVEGRLTRPTGGSIPILRSLHDRSPIILGVYLLSHLTLPFLPWNLRPHSGSPKLGTWVVNDRHPQNPSTKSGVGTRGVHTLHLLLPRIDNSISDRGSVTKYLNL